MGNKKALPDRRRTSVKVLPTGASGFPPPPEVPLLTEASDDLLLESGATLLVE
jgi:hypothetical protein